MNKIWNVTFYQIFNNQDRIINGNSTKGPLPYQLKNEPGCGSTLISSKYAISALHCPAYPGMEVVAGAYYYNEIDEPCPENIQKRKVKNVYRPASINIFPDIVINSRCVLFSILLFPRLASSWPQDDSY